MDELTAALEGSFQVTSGVNSTHAPHPRFSQYKSKSSTSMSQENRRQQVLKLQKQRRLNAANLVRRLVDNSWDDDDNDDDYYDDDDEGADDGLEDTCEDMNVDYTYVRRPGRNYRDQLMLSEWMLEVPASFADDWTMIPCPVGKRNLVIASKGQTRSYSRSGWLVNTFQSSLPGGARSQSHWRIESTILDCIYCEVTRKFYVLDMMCWKQTPIYDSEAEFRFYWLKTKFEEISHIRNRTESNPYPFEILPNYECKKDSIVSALTEDFSFEIDGLLFYHKNAAYTFGTTPLVVWLKAYMLPEILSVDVPQKFLSLAPASYIDFTTHSVQVRQEAAEKELWKQNVEAQKSPADNRMDAVEQVSS